MSESKDPSSSGISERSSATRRADSSRSESSSSSSVSGTTYCEGISRSALMLKQELPNGIRGEGGWCDDELNGTQMILNGKQVSSEKKRKEVGREDW